MKNSSENNFFKLFEDSLLDPDEFKELECLVLGGKEKLIQLILNSGGLVGFIFAYAVMVMRNSVIKLPKFRKVAIVDIKAGLIINRPIIAFELKEISLIRWHLPSIGIIIELIAAYKRYKRRQRNSMNSHHKFNHTKTYSLGTSESESKGNQIYPVLNQRYLYYLLHFYIHRSIMLNNSQKIFLNINSVVTLPEFTPQVLGYLSAFYDMGIPITLYVANRYVRPHHSSLNMFEKIIAKNGIDADYLKFYCDMPVYLETRPNLGLLCGSILNPNVGVFLASYYTLDDKQLIDFISNNVLPLIKKIQRDWNAKSILIYCHPSDVRPVKLFDQKNIQANVSVLKKEKRMSNFDVVISGNSSVIEEALDEGVPVVYMGNIDQYKYDLYGYVEDGVVLDATQYIPSLGAVKNFYRNSLRKSKIYINGIATHERMNLIDAILK